MEQLSPPKISSSLCVRQCGWESCAASYQYGPAVRDHFLIHFVASGSGSFWTRERVYTLCAGQAFLILPGQVATYRADAAHPWTYAWVGYEGYDAAWLTQQTGLSYEQPVCECSAAEESFALLQHMAEMISGMRLGALAALGGLYQFFALLGQSAQLESPEFDWQYYRKALWYMEGNYHLPIRIAQVAEFVGLSRSQLFRVFDRAVKLSPKACLTSIRLRHAKRLLESGGVTLAEIAASVGISSPARLGVLFKERFGMTLSEYQRRLTPATRQTLETW